MLCADTTVALGTTIYGKPDDAAHAAPGCDRLQAGDADMALTESLAMTPAASVSGFYMAHPEATYFNVGRIGDDQLQDWAQRQQMAPDLARRRLAPVL